MKNKTINHEFRIWNILYKSSEEIAVDFSISSKNFPQEVMDSMEETLIKEDLEEYVPDLCVVNLFLRKDTNGEYFGTDGGFSHSSIQFNNVPNTKFPLYFLDVDSDIMTVPYELDEDFLNELKYTYEKCVEYAKEWIAFNENDKYQEKCFNYADYDFSELENGRLYPSDDMENDLE